MSEPGSPRDDDAARAEALFRYRVIAPLLDEPAHAPLCTRVAEVASHRHPHPSRGEVAISIRTLWTWLARFRSGGIDALRPRHRRDHGTLRALDAAALDRAEVLRRELPARWTSTVIDILVREGTVAKAEVVHRATIDRHLRRRGASRRQLVVLGAKPTIKMQFDAFGDLWVGDYHHGPKVLAPAGHATTAKLGAFIGISALVAEPGCGKSLLLGQLTDDLQKQGHVVHYFAHATVGPFGLVNVLARKVGQAPRRSRAETALAVSQALLDDERKHLLVLDAAGARGQAVFDDDAVAALFDVGAGVPRRLNRAASSAMIVAASRKKNTVAAQDVHDARVDRGRA